MHTHVCTHATHSVESSCSAQAVSVVTTVALTKDPSARPRRGLHTGLGPALPEPGAVGAAPTCHREREASRGHTGTGRPQPASASVPVAVACWTLASACTWKSSWLDSLPPARCLSHAKPTAPPAATPRLNASARPALHSQSCQAPGPLLVPGPSTSELQPGDSQAHLMPKPFSGCRSEGASPPPQAGGFLPRVRPTQQHAGRPQSHCFWNRACQGALSPPGALSPRKSMPPFPSRESTEGSLRLSSEHVRALPGARRPAPHSTPSLPHPPPAPGTGASFVSRLPGTSACLSQLPTIPALTQLWTRASLSLWGRSNDRRGLTGYVVTRF